MSQDDIPDDDQPNDRATLWGAVVIVVLVVGSWFLVQNLVAMSKLQDCVMSGRHNCAPIDTSKLPR